MGAKRRTLERGWIAASVAYGCLRVTLVWTFLDGYGVDPWAFLAVELSSSAVYGLASARAMGGLVNRRYPTVRRWAPIALVSYLAPDAYIFSRSGRMPGSVLSVVVGVFAVMLTLTVVGIVREVRRGGGGGRESNPPDGVLPSRLF